MVRVAGVGGIVGIVREFVTGWGESGGDVRGWHGIAVLLVSGFDWLLTKFFLTLPIPLVKVECDILQELKVLRAPDVLEAILDSIRETVIEGTGESSAVPPSVRSFSIKFH